MSRFRGLESLRSRVGLLNPGNDISELHELITYVKFQFINRNYKNYNINIIEYPISSISTVYLCKFLLCLYMTSKEKGSKSKNRHNKHIRYKKIFLNPYHPKVIYIRIYAKPEILR